MDEGMPIRWLGGVSHQRWHEIAGHPGDRTQAMNVAGGVLVRSFLEWSEMDGQNISNSISITFIPGLAVVQQWVAVVDDEDGEDDEDDEKAGKRIEAHRKIFLDQESCLSADLAIAENGGFLIGSANPRFRRFSADADMARPEPAVVRAAVEGAEKSVPHELEILRLELVKLRSKLADAEDRARRCKMQRDHLLGGLSWNLATADNPMYDEDDGDDGDDEDDGDEERRDELDDNPDSEREEE